MESPGLENIPQVPVNRAEVGPNQDVRNFDKLRLDFPGLEGYFDVPDTVNNLLMPLVCSEMDTAKLFERSLSGFWPEI